MPDNRMQELLAELIAGDMARLQGRLPPAARDGGHEMPEGMTPLMVAAACGHESAVELLLLRGADPSRRDTRGYSAAAYARAAGHPHLAERLDIVVDQERTMR